MSTAGHAQDGSRSRWPRWGVIGIAGALIGLAIVVRLWWRLPLSGTSISPPNLLLITLDTTRADRIGCYGYRHGESPTIDALSAQGVRYERCYSPVPLTLPSHCSLMTGLVPPRHRVRDNGRDALSAQAETLAEILRRHGYATGAVVGAFVLDRQFGLDQGFDHYDDDMSEGSTAGTLFFAERNAQRVTDAAITWWTRDQRTARFLWVHYFDPHAPYEPPGFDPTFASLAPYDAEIRFVDTQLKRLLATVEADQDRETLIVLTADHGEGLGDHREVTHGVFTYGTTLRVPLVIRFPARRNAGHVVRSAVSLVDVMPSVLGWLGIPSPTGMDGAILPTGSAGPEPKRGLLYFESYHPAYSYGWSPLFGCVEGPWKLIRAPRPELYHLGNDPHEENNLYTPADAVALRLTARLDQLGDEFRQRGTLDAAALRVTPAGLAKLRSLGYVGVEQERSRTPPEVIPSGPDPKDMIGVLEKIQLAQSHITAHQVAPAADLLIQVLGADDPRNKRAVRLLMMLLSEQIDAPQRTRILDCLVQWLTLAPSVDADGPVLADLAAALVEQTRYAEAVDVLERLLAIEPASAMAYRYLGEAREGLGHTAEARRAYRRALELAGPSDPQLDWIDHVRQRLEKLPPEGHAP